MPELSEDVRDGSSCTGAQDSAPEEKQETRKKSEMMAANQFTGDRALRLREIAKNADKSELHTPGFVPKISQGNRTAQSISGELRRIGKMVSPQYFDLSQNTQVVYVNQGFFARFF
jgi:hypothetical protein